MWVVLVIAGLFLLLSSFAVWINRVALNTGVFTDTSSSLLDNDQIRSAVANRAVDELFANVDVQAEVEEQLPADYKGLSGAATAGLRQASYQIVDRALEQPVFQDLFRVALEESHTTLVQVLEGGGDRVSTDEGEVILDLRAIIIEAADRIGIGNQVVDRIPDDAGQIVVLRSEELDTAQNVFQLLKTLAWVLPLLTLAAFGLAVWLARDRRRAVRGIGVVLIVVGFVGIAAARLTKNYVVDALVARRDDREAAGDAWDILTDLMRGSFRLMIVVGLLFLLAAWLAGPGRRALTARGWLAPGLAESRMGLCRARGRRARDAADRDRARLHALARRHGHRRTRRNLDRALAPPDAARVSRRAGNGLLRGHLGRVCRAGGRSSVQQRSSRRPQRPHRRRPTSRPG